jgi:hypothetical protein
MSAAIIAIIVIVAVVVLVVSAMTMTRRRLQQRFGPEYDRVVGEKRSQFRGAAELARRERRVQRLRIHPLTASARAEYAAEWRAVQEGFVDQPRHAVIDGQDLLASVMKERGYPAEDADQIAADLSVTHAATLGHYRAAQEISADAERGDASTEDLRQALIHVRAVFGELLGKPDDAEPTESAGAGPRDLAAGPGNSNSGPRVLDAGMADGASHAPGPAVPAGASRDAALRGDAPPGGPARDGGPRDGAVAANPVRDGAARDDAGTPEPEEQLWRPGVRVPPPRTTTGEKTQ